MLLAVLTVFSLIGAPSSERIFLGAKPNEWPQTESSRVVGEFAARLIVTPDRDWKEKWDTPPETIPYFNEVRRLLVGDKASVLTFIANPKLDDEKRAHVLCDLKGTRPDSTISFDLKEVACLEGEILGPVTNVRLSPAVVEFVAEENDPTGVWIIEIRVRDMNRGTTIELKTSFELVRSQ